MLSIKKALLVVFALIVMCYTAICFPAVVDDHKFNIENANKQYDKINIKLSTQNLNTKDLNAAITVLENLQKSAKECVKFNEEKLKETDYLLSNQLQASDGDDVKFLKSKKALYEKQLSGCHLFVLRADESMVAFKQTIAKLSTKSLFSNSTPIWYLFDGKPFLSLKKYSGKVIAKAAATHEFTASNGYTLLGLALLGLLLGFFLQKKLNPYVRDEKKHPLTVMLSKVTSKFIIPVSFFCFTSIYFAVLFFEYETAPILEAASYALLFYCLSVAVLYYTCILVSDRRRIYNRAVLLLSFIVFSYLLQLCFTDQEISAALEDLSRTLYITILSILTVYLCWPITRLVIKKRWISVPLQIFLVVLLLMINITEWLGYHKFAIFFTLAILFTLLMIAVTWAVIKLIEASVRGIDSKKTDFSRTVRSFLDVKPRRNIVELSIIRLALYLVLACVFLLCFLRVWGVSELHTDYIENALINGFTFSDISISLTRIVSALLVFSAISLIGRVISASISRKYRYGEQHNTQVAVASIMSYIAFSVALVVALLIAGVNFTGLAIIIGALSVGIGMGLQGIVNNFISGIILLIEKPIKIGDRISVGEIEGFVRKIRIRSTQIMTLAREDVMVPNADLISTNVTNYMFRDSNWRVTCQVGVAYGSDTELVKQTMLAVAAEHPDVIQDVPNQPVVLFKQFGDSSLVFELWCVISDVNKKFIVASDLNFAIDQAFRRHKITIAFPQRDIHIKDQVAPEASS